MQSLDNFWSIDLRVVLAFCIGKTAAGGRFFNRLQWPVRASTLARHCKASAPDGAAQFATEASWRITHHLDGKEEEWHDSIVSFWLSPSRLQRQ